MSARDEAVEMIRRICPPHLSADEYGQILAEKFDAHRNEVLAEEGLLPKADVVAWLVKKARELRARGSRDSAMQAAAVDVVASKLDRGAVRPDNLRTLPADFFEPGHTYADDEHGWKFRVDTVTTHPEDGERTALGWRFWKGVWDAYAYGEDDWEIHQLVGHHDITESGEDR
jgi:hypothetical protein